MSKPLKSRCARFALSTFDRIRLTSVRSAFERLSTRVGNWILDIATLLAFEIAVLISLGQLANLAPLGDDPLVHLTKIVDLAENFGNFQWDPRSFNGYIPATAFAWASYGPPALFVRAGLDPAGVFHGTYVAYFVAIGPSVYYFARSIGTKRGVTLGLSMLAWTSVGLWGYIGGGAYSRVFTLPFAFASLALTYRYADHLNSGRKSGRLYWATILAWSLTTLGDVYMAAWPLLVAIPFVLLSAGKRNLRAGLIRTIIIFLPTAAVTSWYWVPLLYRLLSVSSPPSELIQSPASQLFWAGPFLSTFVTIFRRRSHVESLGPTVSAMLISLNLSSIYFLIMGAVTPLWPYLPRIWAAYDSLNILSFLFPLTLACVLVSLSPLRPRILERFLPVALIALIVGSAFPAVYILRPPDRNPLNASIAQEFSTNLSVPAGYRVSLQGRILTRWFPYSYPQAFQTGGRVIGLDLSPFYRSWYETEVFYKNDRATIPTIYIEDQPPVNVTRLSSSPENFASTAFWLDWFGVGALVLDSGSYPVKNTAQNFSARGALFSTKSSETGREPLVFVNPMDSSPIMVATNASVVGFYSQLGDSKAQYDCLLALLSYVGLDSRYVVPVYVSTLSDVGPKELNAIITDEYSYSKARNEIDNLAAGGSEVIVGRPGFLSQLQAQGLSGSVSLLRLTSSVFSEQTDNLTRILSVTSQVIKVNPSSWAVNYTENAQASLVSDPNNVTVSVKVPDPTKSALFEIETHLASPVLLASQLESRVQLRADVASSLKLSFASANYTGSSVSSTQNIYPNRWNDLNAPLSKFTWQNDPETRFATATTFKLGVVIPPGNKNSVIQLGYVSLSEPDYAVYGLRSARALSMLGLLLGPGAQEMMLSDGSGAMSGVYLESGGQFNQTIVPLAAFNSQSQNSFDRIIVVEPMSNEGQTLVSFARPASSEVFNRWDTNQNLKVGSLQGFRGLVWKETYVSDWRILGRSPEGAEVPFPYLLAGPGLIYVPFGKSPLGSLQMSYHDVIYDWVIGVIAGTSVVPLITFRRKIYGVGTLREG